ncbi:MAG: efflux RND transporter periplasmic adaptor subunit, partial [Mesorhizobium sp.]
TSTLREAQASLAVNQAALRTAELNLSYTEIRAPFAGRIGRSQASVGTLVSVAGTVLNSLVQLDPIYVTFNPSETDLTQIEEARAAGPISVDVLLPGETEPRQKGDLTFMDNTIDRSTGTITARATVGNGKFTLLPGQYVRVRLHVKEQPDALMVPQTALGSGQLGKYLYVVGKDNTVDQRIVSLGPTNGDQVAILSGVAEGDRVITGNLQKIGPGMPISPLPEKPAT